MTHTDRIRLVCDAVVSSYIHDISARSRRSYGSPDPRRARPRRAFFEGKGVAQLRDRVLADVGDDATARQVAQAGSST